MPKKRNTQLDDRPLPHLALTHGQTLWLLSELGYREGVRASTFNYYLKSLRKLGVPFEKEQRGKPHQHVVYVFEDVMELALALLLRVYGTLPDAIAIGLRKFRDELRPIYRQAYLEVATPKFQSVNVKETGGQSMFATGLYLDLNIHYAAGQMIAFGPPRAVSSFEATCIYLRADIPSRAYLPLNLSVVAKSIIAETRHLPKIGRGHTARQSSRRRRLKVTP